MAALSVLETGLDIFTHLKQIILRVSVLYLASNKRFNLVAEGVFMPYNMPYKYLSCEEIKSTCHSRALILCRSVYKTIISHVKRYYIAENWNPSHWCLQQTAFNYYFAWQNTKRVLINPLDYPSTILSTRNYPIFQKPRYTLGVCFEWVVVYRITSFESQY